MTDILASPRHELLASPIHPSHLPDLTFSPVATHGAHSDDFPTFDIDTLLSALKTPPPGVRTSQFALSPIMPAFDTLPSPPRDLAGPSGPSDGERCPNCQKFEREETAAGDVVCIGCGLVLSRDCSITSAPEWFGAEDPRSRMNGAPIFTPVPSVSPAAIFEKLCIDAQPAEVPEPVKIKSSPSSSFISPSAEAAEIRRTREACDAIEIGVQHLQASPAVEEAAKEWYQRFVRAKKRAGQKAGRYSKLGVYGSCLFLACKQSRAPRTFKEIATIGLANSIGEDELRRCYSWFRQRVEINKEHSTLHPRTKPSDLVNRICQNVNDETAGRQSRIPAWMISICMEVADSASPLLEGRSPASVAAGAVMFVLSYVPDKRGRWTATDISKAANVSPTTLYSIREVFQNYSTALLPDNFFIDLEKKQWN